MLFIPIGWAITAIWAALLFAAGGWYGSAGAGIFLALIFVWNWTAACLMQTLEHQEGETPRWMALVICGRAREQEWLAPGMKIMGTTLFLLAIALGTIGSLKDVDPDLDIELTFPIFLAISTIPSIILIERHFRRRYTRIWP